MRIRWNANDPPPAPVGHFKEFQIFLEGRRLFSRRTRALVWSDTRRFADVIGPGYDGMSKAGWYDTRTAPFCFTAAVNGQVVAAAWACHICSRHGKQGINLAYALIEHVEGRGLARLLSAMAVRELYLDLPEVDFVNVQSRMANARSSALARSFGMQLMSDQGFSALRPGSDEATSYCTYRLGAPAFLSAARQVIAQGLWPADNAVSVVDSAWNRAEVD